MSGWLRPEGPESVATYWSRRIVVIAAAVVVLVLAIVLVSTAAQGTEPGTAGPAPAATTDAPAPSGTATAPSASASSAATSAPTTTGSPAPTGASPTGASPTGASPTGTASSPSTSTSPSARPSPTAPVTPACDPTRLRATLQGDASPEPGQRVVFSLSVINGNPTACVLKRTPATVELKIYSGTDRIWSTDDCARLVPASSQVLKPEQAVAWRLAWDGRRSAAGCGTRPEVPKAGTYFATFQLAGAKPVQQRMLLSAS